MRDRAPELRDVEFSFTNQVLAQVELALNLERYDKKVYTLPKHLDEKVARLHLAQIGVHLTKLTARQGEYLGLSPEGPFKPDHYRYCPETGGGRLHRPITYHPILFTVSPAA